MTVLLSRTRRAAYRAGSVLGDVQAVASGSPAKVARRFLRKSIWRAFSSLMKRSRL